MVRRDDERPADEDRRMKASDAKMRSKLISDDVEERLIAVTGLSKSDLYNRRGGLAERGLAALLEPGDRIVEILPDHVVIETKDGTRQTVWNMNRELPFLTSCPDVPQKRPEPELDDDDGDDGDDDGDGREGGDP